MDIILQQGLEHQQIPVERIAHVFSNSRVTPAGKYYENPMPDYGDTQLNFSIRDITYQKEMYNPQIHSFAVSKRNVQVSESFSKTKRPILIKNQMPFQYLFRLIRMAFFFFQKQQISCAMIC